MWLQKDFVHFIADAQEIKFTRKLVIIMCFQMQVQILEAFVSALWEVIHFVLLVLISLYLENGFQSFHIQPPILRGSQEKKSTNFLSKVGIGSTY